MQRCKYHSILCCPRASRQRESRRKQGKDNIAGDAENKHDEPFSNDYRFLGLHSYPQSHQQSDGSSVKAPKDFYCPHRRRIPHDNLRLGPHLKHHHQEPKWGQITACACVCVFFSRPRFDSSLHESCEYIIGLFLAVLHINGSISTKRISLSAKSGSLCIERLFATDLFK